MILRYAEVEETDEVFGMYEDFSGKELERIGLKYNPDRLMRNVAELIKNKAVVIAVNPIGRIIGAVAGVVAPCAFTDDIFFSASLFYVRPDHRHRTVEFIKSLMEFLKKTTITKIVVSNPAYSPTGMDRFYKMNGFQQLENHYIRTVKHG